MSNIASPTPPTLRATLDALKMEIFQDLNCHQVGLIQSYNAEKQTASVQIAALKILPSGDSVPYPLLTDCPVYFPRGGNAYMTFPVTQGDPCLVLFNDQDIDNWFTTGSVATPNTARSHSLSDGLILVGIRNLSTPVPSVDPDAVQLWNGATLVSLKNDNTVIIHSDGGKVAVDNGIENLKTLMDSLFSVLTTWVNTGGSTPNPATIAALDALKTRFDNLLQ